LTERSVGIVTDSAASLPPELAAEHGVAVVPMGLSVAGTGYHDGDLTLDELLARLGEGVPTSGPSPGDFAQAVGRLLPQAESVLVLTIPSPLSIPYSAAHLAAESFDGAARVVDTATAAGAEGLVVLAAAQAARSGDDIDAVEAAARSVIDRVRLVATVNSLDRLVQSGRVPNIAGWAGNRLGVNPLFEFIQGKVKALRPAFSREAALSRIVATCRDAKPGPGARLHAAALHALDPEAADLLLAQVTTGERNPTAFVGSFSPVMVTHTGPGLAGLAWWWEE